MCVGGGCSDAAGDSQAIGGAELAVERRCPSPPLSRARVRSTPSLLFHHSSAPHRLIALLSASSLCCRHIALLLGSLLPGAKPVQLTYGGSTAVGVSIHKCEFTPKHDTRSHEVGSSDTKNSLGASVVKVDEKTLLAQFWPIAYKPIATSWNQNTSFSCWIRI